ncbi:FAST kinase domain-containing protein 2, mitochondrial [Engystomops pustulosus]|uniref:FAST kinase domain-containing protein 2, mitochondrial n=1 Tax=Engystomops pustulosus TaxID=76066 RepID=UPI003AFA5444
MHNMPLPYLLRTVRLLQSCQSYIRGRLPSILRTSSSSSGLLLTHKPWTPASTVTSIPFRFFNQETSVIAEENNTVSESSVCDSADHSHAHSGEDSLKADVQNPSTHPPRKLSCVEVLDAFSGSAYSQHELYDSIKSMWNVLANSKKLKSSDKQLITDHPNFSTLCYEVMKSAPSMSNKFLVYSLNVFVSLKVNQKTRLVQTLLSICQQRLSSLKVGEISILANSLKMLESNKTVDILNSGICLLIELKCEDIKDVTLLQNLMRIAPTHLRQKFEEKALQMVYRFTVPQCLHMFSVLAEVNLHSESLLDACSHKLIDCLDELSCRRIISLTGYCSKLSYFNEKLLSAIGDNIMNNIYMWEKWQISAVLTSMAFLRFRYVPLLDYFADKIIEDVESLKTYNLMTVSKVFSIVNHLPEERGKFLETLNTALDSLMNSMKKKDLLRTVYNLCLLGLVPAAAIQKLLEDKSLYSTLDNVEKSYLGHIKLCWLLESGSRPYSIENLENVKANHSDSVMMCHTFLKNYFTDPCLYQENMQFPSSYFIDFVFTLDTNQRNLIPMGDVQKLENSQNITRIAVLCCTAGSFTLGNLHPIGKMAVKIRHLRSLGFHVVVVPVHQFIMLSEVKRVEFLRENILMEIPSNQKANEIQQISGVETDY